jgi:hypothetical protein
MENSILPLVLSMIPFMSPQFLKETCLDWREKSETKSKCCIAFDLDTGLYLFSAGALSTCGDFAGRR